MHQPLIWLQSAETSSSPHFPGLWSIAPIRGDYSAPRTCFAGNDLLQAPSRFVPAPTTCGRGGIGRRAALRSLWPKGRGSSSLLDRTRTSLTIRFWQACGIGAAKLTIGMPGATCSRLAFARTETKAALHMGALPFSLFAGARRTVCPWGSRSLLRPRQRVRAVDDEPRTMTRGGVGSSTQTGPIPSIQGQPRCN